MRRCVGCLVLCFILRAFSVSIAFGQMSNPLSKPPENNASEYPVTLGDQIIFSIGPGIKEPAVPIETHHKPLPGGAENTFTTQNPNLITAIHRRVGAQQPDKGGPSLWITGKCEENFSLIHHLSDRGSEKQQDLLNRNMPHINGSRRYPYFESDEPIYPRMPLSKEISLIEDQKVFPFSSNDTSSEKMGSDLVFTSLAEEKTLSNQEKQVLTDQSRNWKGIGRDTAYFMGYQVVVAGALYLSPESVTTWTDEQKKATVNKWADNVQSAKWDKDAAWINYIGHPYWGATYYIRARERGFGEFSSFWYSAFLSGMFEYGIEAFFEQPSYQDLILTPVGGLLIGKFVFEPIRASIKSKTELIWFDHLLLVLTDPLGAANSLVDRSLGVKSNVRLTVPGLTPLRFDRPSYHTVRSLKRQDENIFRQHEFGIGIDLMW